MNAQDRWSTVATFDLRSQSKVRANKVLTGLAQPMTTGMQVRTHHGGAGNKTPEQWKWWGIKARWDLN